MKESCEICTSYCRLCQYRSTEVAVRKHMQRVHPTTTYDCEVCGMQFGIRYDMRRHRMLHFDDNGLLNKEAKTYLRQNNKLELLSLTLADLEVNFVARKPTTSQIPGGCSDGTHYFCHIRKMCWPFTCNNFCQFKMSLLSPDLF